MALEVEFITLGDASTRLNVPAPTLRHWTDQLEEFDVHYVLRNNRKERTYQETDIEVFAFLRDLKEEYGRRTTTRDLGYMIAEKGLEGELQLRSKEDAPVSERTNRTADLLNQEDIQRLMQSERVKQFIGVVIAENTKIIKDELIDEVRESVREELRLEMQENRRAIEEMLATSIERDDEREKREKERLDKMEEFLKVRDKQTTEWVTEMREQNKKRQLDLEEQEKAKEEREANKGFFSKLFGGK
ncbi:MerR family transcriptional regulator [Viridibacillus arvi]|uniref:MerR family transcriptional regulator n=1 Tax=Viridibacillus arvi TaxID=263475 RepID=UPI0034CFF45C